MNPEHVSVYMENLVNFSKVSKCVRRQFAAYVIDEHDGIQANGYNGGPRGGPQGCGDPCLRLTIPSGERTEIGCYHAEENAIINMARAGKSTRGKYMFVTGEPCLKCAKIMYQAGISRVYYLRGGYSTDAGLDFLRTYGVVVVELIPSHAASAAIRAPMMYLANPESTSNLNKP